MRATGLRATDLSGRIETIPMAAVLIFLFAFVAVQLAVAVWTSRRIATEDDFLIAGRRLGPAMAGISIFATWFGAESCIGAAGEAYRHGFRLDAPEPFAYGVCLIATGVFFAARLWRLRITTIADFLAQRFGKSCGPLAAVLLLPSSLLWAAAQIRAFGHIVAVNSDGAIGVDLAIAIAASIAVFYTVTGGLLADVLTDVLQCGVLVIGLVVLLVVVLTNLPDAPAAADAVLPAAEHAPTSLLDSLEGWAVPIGGSVVAQEVLSRTFAARSATVARKAAIGGGLCYVLVGMIPVLIGSLGPRFLGALDDPETVLPNLSRELLPTALNFLFAGALIAAILSTVDSCLLVVSSLVARNLAPRPLAADGTERSRLKLARMAVVGGGAVAWSLASSGTPVHELVEEASGFGSAGVFVLACIGVFSGVGGRWAATLALVGGLLSWIAGRHAFADNVSHPYLLSLASAVAGFAVGWMLDARQRAGSART